MGWSSPTGWNNRGWNRPAVVAPSFLLDSLSATANYAHSTRKLRSAYAGSALKVTTSAAGNATQNIGFDGSGNLDSTSLASFIGANSGTVTTWYDQKGTIDGTQSTLANQPRIVNAGTIDTLNSNPAILFIAANHTYLNRTSTIIAQPWTIAACIRQKTVTGTQGITDSQSVASRLLTGTTTTPNYDMYAGSGPTNGGTPNTTQTHSTFWIFNGASSSLYVDGTAILSGINAGTNSDGNSCYIGTQQSATTNNFDGYICEIIYFNSVLSAGDMSTIRTSWQSYWGAV